MPPAPFTEKHVVLPAFIRIAQELLIILADLIHRLTNPNSRTSALLPYARSLTASAGHEPSATASGIHRQHNTASC